MSEWRPGSRSWRGGRESRCRSCWLQQACQVEAEACEWADIELEVRRVPCPGAGRRPDDCRRWRTFALPDELDYREPPNCLSFEAREKLQAVEAGRPWDKRPDPRGFTERSTDLVIEVVKHRRPFHVKQAVSQSRSNLHRELQSILFHVKQSAVSLSHAIFAIFYEPLPSRAMPRNRTE